MQMLKPYGIEPVGQLVTLEQALRMRRPLVLKADSSEHKTDKGLVFVNLKTDREIRQAYSKIRKHAEVLAQPFVKGIEFIVGLHTDSTFGKLLMLGAGGTLVELVRDVSFRAIPLKPMDIDDMLSELRVSRVFKGFRGLKPSKKALKQTLYGLSRFAAEHDFKSIDINPLIINQKNAFAVDIRVV